MWTVQLLLLSSALVQAPLLLDLRDHQREVDVHVGQVIHINLPWPDSEPRQRWILLEPPLQHIVRMQRSGEGPERRAEQPQHWAFTAMGPGSQRLRFELRRRGEVKQEPERSFTVLLEVLPEP